MKAFNHCLPRFRRRGNLGFGSLVVYFCPAYVHTYVLYVLVFRVQIRFVTLYLFVDVCRPKSGSMLLYSRKKVRYRRDGYCWKKRKDGKTTREDHMKLKVQGMEVRTYAKLEHELKNSFLLLFPAVHPSKNGLSIFWPAFLSAVLSLPAPFFILLLLFKFFSKKVLKTVLLLLLYKVALASFSFVGSTGGSFLIFRAEFPSPLLSTSFLLIRI